MIESFSPFDLLPANIFDGDKAHRCLVSEWLPRGSLERSYRYMPRELFVPSDEGGLAGEFILVCIADISCESC